MFLLKSINKYINRIFISSLLIYLILIVFNCSIVYSSGDISNVNSVQRENSNNDLVDFVENIYINYSKGNFQYIYNELHPAVKEKLTEKEYTEFQEKNFEKYKLEISNIDVKKDVNRIKLPNKYTDFIKDNGMVYKIKVNYEMDFSIVGSREKRQTEKDVLLYINDSHIYLLWDHSVITN